MMPPPHTSLASWIMWRSGVLGVQAIHILAIRWVCRSWTLSAISGGAGRGCRPVTVVTYIIVVTSVTVVTISRVFTVLTVVT